MDASSVPLIINVAGVGNTADDIYGENPAADLLLWPDSCTVPSGAGEDLLRRLAR
jgi:hypothetical protein